MKGGTTISPSAPPPGFPEWLGQLNERLGLRPPKGYRPTSPMGRRLAVAYVRALAEGHTAEDLRRAVDVAMAKVARGFAAAGRPTWILGNLDELTAEAGMAAAATNGKGGTRHERPGFYHRY